MVWIAFISAPLLVWLISRPNKEIARIHATRVRPALTKIPFQVGALLLLNCPIKVERCLTGGALHRESEGALPINGPMQRIYSLGRGFERYRATQGSISLGLHYKNRDRGCLLRCLIKHRSVIRASYIEAVSRRRRRSGRRGGFARDRSGCGRGGSDVGGECGQRRVRSGDARGGGS